MTPRDDTESTDLFYASSKHLDELLVLIRAGEVKTEKHVELEALLEETLRREKSHRNEEFDKLLGDILLTDQSLSGALFREYISKLKEIANPELSREEINQELLGLLKGFIFKTMTDNGISELSVLQLEICVSGSLARNMATPYSDIDCFIIIPSELPEAEREKIKTVAGNLRFIANKISLATDQFIFDTALLNPSVLCGTVEEVAKRLSEYSDTIQIISVLNSKSISENTEMRDRLVSLIGPYFEKLLPIITMGTSSNLTDLYLDKLFTDFKPHLKSKDPIHVKDMLIRPVEFFLLALCADSAIDARELSNIPLLVDTLYKQKKIDQASGHIIVALMEISYNIRKNLHIIHKKEYDVISSSKNILKFNGTTLRNSLQHNLMI